MLKSQNVLGAGFPKTVQQNFSCHFFPNPLFAGMITI